MASAAKSYLAFRVARRDMAVEAAQVRGILPLTALVPVPGHGLVGLVSLGRHTIQVIDLAARLRLTGTGRGPQPKIVVIEIDCAGHRHTTAFVADRISGICEYRERSRQGGFLRGQGRPRRLIRFEQLLTEDDLAGMWAVSL